jgi:hypothetical protein
MSINDINLNKRQINFLAAYEAKHGQPATVTRKDLLAFKDSLQPNETGPLGFVIRWPAWLTNSGTFTTSRAVYSLPWAKYNEWKTANPSAIPTPAAAAV